MPVRGKEKDHHEETKQHEGGHGLRIKNHESRIKNSEGEFGFFKKAERGRA
jgi:hypothetical protein